MERSLNREETKEKALRLLEFRSHSKEELRKKLKTHGANDDDIDSVMEFLEEYGLVNDLRYAKALASDLCKLKRLGKKRIYQELRIKGISAEDAEEAVSEIEDDEELLEKLIAKKLGGNFDKKNRDKAIRYFMYRGYNLSDIKDVIERLMADEY